MDINVTISFKLHNIDEWYDGEDLSKKEMIERIKEDLSDFEILNNNIPVYAYDVKITKDRK